MVESINKVILVVDKDYGPRLPSLVGTGAIWIIDTEANRMAAEECWRLNPEPKREVTVTTFKYPLEDTARETCLHILNVVDLHHGEYSGGYSVLEIIGAPMSKSLRTAITKLGFNTFVKTAEGFRASR